MLLRLSCQNVFELPLLLNSVFVCEGLCVLILLLSFICMLLKWLEVSFFESVITLTLFFTGKNTNKIKLLRSDSKILGTSGIFIENSNGRKESLRSLYVAQVNPRRRYVFIVTECAWVLSSNIRQQNVGFMIAINHLYVLRVSGLG